MERGGDREMKKIERRRDEMEEEKMEENNTNSSTFKPTPTHTQNIILKNGIPTHVQKRKEKKH